MGLASNATRLRRIAAILQQGAGAAPLPAAVDLLNRALRPLAVLGVFALPGAAFWDAARYGAAMAALAQTPWPVWAIAAGTITLHFLVRSGGNTPRT